MPLRIPIRQHDDCPVATPRFEEPCDRQVVWRIPRARTAAFERDEMAGAIVGDLTRQREILLRVIALGAHEPQQAVEVIRSRTGLETLQSDRGVARNLYRFHLGGEQPLALTNTRWPIPQRVLPFGV